MEVGGCSHAGDALGCCNMLLKNVSLPTSHIPVMMKRESHLFPLFPLLGRKVGCVSDEEPSSLGGALRHEDGHGRVGKVGWSISGGINLITQQSGGVKRKFSHQVASEFLTQQAVLGVSGICHVKESG